MAFGLEEVPVRCTVVKQRNWLLSIGRGPGPCDIHGNGVQYILHSNDALITWDPCQHKQFAMHSCLAALQIFSTTPCKRKLHHSFETPQINSCILQPGSTMIQNVIASCLQSTNLALASHMSVE